MTVARFLKNPALAPICLVIVSVVVRLMFLTPVEDGGDASNRWGMWSLFLCGHDVHIWDHHATRFGINIWVMLVQAIFGNGVEYYYAIPIAMAVFQSLFLYAILKEVTSKPLAILVPVAILFFPDMARAGSQLLPAIFSGAYVLGTFWMLLRFSRDEKSVYLALAIFFFFFAYLTKITTLFFLPGIVLGIWLWFRNFRYVLWFCGSLFVFFLIETSLYKIGIDVPAGRLSVLMSTYHGTDRNYPITFWGLFERYIVFSIYWKVLFYSFLASGVYYFARMRNSNVLTLIYLATFSFFLCVTFYVKRLDPLAVGLLFHQRYLMVSMPPMGLALAIFCYQLTAPRLGHRITDGARLRLDNIVQGGACILAITLPFFYLMSDSTLDKMQRISADLTAAYDDGVPIVAQKKSLQGRRLMDTGKKSVYLAKNVFLRFDRGECEGRPHFLSDGEIHYLHKTNSEIADLDGQCRLLLKRDANPPGIGYYSGYSVNYDRVDCGNANQMGQTP